MKRQSVNVSGGKAYSTIFTLRWSSIWLPTEISLIKQWFGYTLALYKNTNKKQQTNKHTNNKHYLSKKIDNYL